MPIVHKTGSSTKVTDRSFWVTPDWIGSPIYHEQDEVKRLQGGQLPQ